VNFKTNAAASKQGSDGLALLATTFQIHAALLNML